MDFCSFNSYQNLKIKNPPQIWYNTKQISGGFFDMKLNNKWQLIQKG
jgi:hypothetical protein